MGTSTFLTGLPPDELLANKAKREKLDSNTPLTNIATTKTSALSVMRTSPTYTVRPLKAWVYGL